jgi:uncharacterized membrane protein
VTRLGVAVVLVVPLGLLAGASSRGGAPGPAAMNAPTAACGVAPLPTLGGLFGSPLAANQEGIAVGAATDADGVSHAVLWRSGRPQRLATGAAESVAVAVNARGDVVGTGRSGTDAFGWVWSRAATTRLQAEHGRVAVPAAINDRGLIVGALAESAGAHGTVRNEDENERAAAWDSATAAPVSLSPLPGDDGGYAFAVDNHGRIGGISASTRFRPVVWAAGNPRALPDLGGGYAAVRALDDSGVAAGDAVGTDGRDHPVMWDRAGRIIDLGLPTGARSGQAKAILRDGVIIGTAEVPTPGGGFRSQAVRWLRPGTFVLLPSVRDATASSGAGATDATSFVGYFMDADGGRHPVRWRCGK